MSFTSRLMVLFLILGSLPAQAMVPPMFHDRTDVPNLANSNAGRYLYTGDVPRFAAQDLELYVSKMGLTLRVQAWVTPQLVANYRNSLILHWKRIYDAFQDPAFSLSVLRQYQKESDRAADQETKLWLRVASQYAKHNLEGHGIDVYKTLPDAAYKDNVLTALLREYLDNSDLEIDDGLELAADALKGSTVSTAEQAKSSVDLFMKRFKDNYTAVKPQPDRPGYQGFMTLVYPIAAAEAGPFDQPAEGIHEFAIPGSIEGRWWSNKWQDDFGGLPFLQVTDDGVAFHGPISNHPGDIWFLMRDFVSHSCMRMAVSDILELRALAPADLVYPLPGTTRPAIPVYIMEWPDVVDWKRTGTPQIMDVEYYSVPFRMTDNDTGRWSGSRAQSMFRQDHYQKFDNQLASGNRYHSFSETESGLPLYSVVPDAAGKPALVKNGFYMDSLHFGVFKYHGIRAIQYHEAGETFPDPFDDIGGKYPPGYFQQ